MKTLKTLYKFQTQNFSFRNIGVMLLLFFSFGLTQAQAADYYVKTGATGTGTSFTNAFGTLQQALSLAISGDKIYVGKGTYTPTQKYDVSTGNTSTTADDRLVSFKIPDGVEVYGGFAGTETGVIDQIVLNARDFITNLTILSGDINEDDTFSGTFPTFVYGNYIENAYHVVYTKGVSAATKVSGFTIKGGNANGTNANNSHGAGWLNDGGGAGKISSPSLSNIIISQNVAKNNGGGMYNNGQSGTSSPSLVNCSFSQNNATNGSGGGMYNNGESGTSSPSLVNCSFSQNNAVNGGGMYNYGPYGTSSPSLVNCSFSQNNAVNGGGMFNAGTLGTSSPSLVNCSFSQNNASTKGGGMYNEGVSGTSSPQITNSIFWDNTSSNGKSWYNNSATVTVSYSLVEEANADLSTGTTIGTSGGMLYVTDPKFVSTTDLRLQATSPALNVGSNTAIAGVATDLAGNVRVQGTTVDMGAYERTPPQTEFYVNATGNDSNAGTSFSTAFATLQQALSVATSGSKIYVATGTYKPTVAFDFDGNSTLDPREVTFKIPSGVEVYGGFAGTETVIDQIVLNARNFVTNLTILSGDIDGNDNVTGTFPSLVYGGYAENAYHVVYTKGVSAATKVSGFTIKGGNAYGGSGNGAGWFNDGSGSGNTSNPSLSNSIFSQNTAEYGGGMYNSGVLGTSSPSLVNCSFSQNTATSEGGGMLNNGVIGTSSPSLVNCSFSQNVAPFGGGMFNNGTSGTSSPQIKNSIFWGNTGTGKSWHNSTATPNVSYSLVQEASGGLSIGTTAGTGMLYAQDPLFTNAAIGDLTLQAGSPALNVGSNAAITATGVTTDLAGNVRIQGTAVDMGTYERFVAPPQTEFYVKTAVTGTGSGTDFANATTLQQALSVATTGSKIYVAKGTYKPTQTYNFSSGNIDPTANSRFASFKIPTGVEVHGGFAGNEGAITQAVLDARDFITNLTILSGDINGDDNITGTFPTLSYDNYAENAFHVVYTKNVSAATKVSGFTIKGGNATGVEGDGAGWLNDGSGAGNSSNPSLSNIIFSQNIASANGGGMFNNGYSTGTSSPSLVNCSFSQNKASSGGGMYNNAFSGTSRPSLVNCSFLQNAASGFGGGMHNNGASGTSSPSLVNCSFSQNKANVGGGMYNEGASGASSPSLVNCSFSQNAANANGGGMFNNGYNGTNSPQITNSIFWGNTASNGKSWYNDTATPDVSYSLVEEASGDLSAGTTVVAGMLYNQDPKFTNAATGDLTLQAGSPALNVGDNAAIPAGVTTDLAGNPRIQATTVDMGAYEGAVTVVPIINIVSTITNFTSCAGTVSAEQSYTVSGSNLTANISIGPPTGFEISTGTGGSFVATNPIVLTQTSGNVISKTIYVRQTATAANGASGNIAHTSTGATQKDVAIAASTVNPSPALTGVSVASVTDAATAFNLVYTGTSNSPTTYSLVNTGTVLAGFTSITDAALTTSPLTITIPASAANTYTFNLTVKNASGCVSAIVPITLTVTSTSIVVTPVTPVSPVVAPSSPTGFTATTISPTQINLSWNGVSNNAVEYQVFQNGVLIATLPLGTTTYQITGLSPNTSYSFSLVAVNRNNGQTTTSQAVSAREYTFPETPTLLSVSTLCQNGQATVKLSSSANVYRIYDQMSGGNLLVESYDGSFLLPNISQTTTFYAASFGMGSKKESQNRTVVIVTVEPTFEAKIIGDNPRFSCDNSTVLEADLVENATRYTWFRNGVEVGTGTSFEAKFSADYQVRISKGVCSFLSEKVSVQVGFTPIAKIAQANQTRFCDTGILNATQTNSNATYEWLLDNVVIGEGTQISITKSGIYSLQVTQNGCKASTQIEVTVAPTPENPILEISETQVCPTGEVIISIKNVKPNVVYQWLQNGRAFNVTENSITTSLVGKYSVRAVASQNGACSSVSNEVEFSKFKTTAIYLRESEDKKTLFLEDVNLSQADIRSIEWYFEGKLAANLGTTSTISPTENGYYSAQVINQNGCIIQTRTVYFKLPKEDVITGEEEIKTAIFSIYPNPSKGIFTIRFPKALTEAIQISIFDATGKVIQTQIFAKGNQEFSIDIQNFAKGMYLIRFNQENVSYSKSIILE